VVELCDFLDGRTEPVVRGSRPTCGPRPRPRVRAGGPPPDRLATLHKAVEKQQMVGEADEDLDVIGIADDDLEASVQVFYVRHGRVTGRKGFIVDKVEDLTFPELIGKVLEGMYYEPTLGIPKQVLLPELPDDPALYESWLASCGARRSGSRCRSGGTSGRSRRPWSATPGRS
jgi:excinuclease ABC subunit C